MIPHEQREDVKKLVRRLRGLRGFPNDYQEAVSEIVDALMTAVSFAEAQRFVSDWIRESAETPTPADIYRAVRPAELVPEVGYTQCDKCSDTGFMRVDRGGYVGATPCDCRRKPQ